MSGPFATRIATQEPPASILRPAAKVGAAVPSASEDEDALSRKSVTVPLIHPRYQKKTRLNRTMSVTNESASENESGRSPQSMLSMRSREQLHVRQGPVTHTEQISYRAYACYRHGSKKIHTQSVGYSSDGDLVLHRRDVSQSRRDSSVGSLQRSMVSVEGAVCLNPRAKAAAPLVDGEQPDDRWQQRLTRLPKYPGVRCPKNKKIRNRLVNDHFAHPVTRKLVEMSHNESDPDGLREAAAAAFDPLPRTLEWLRNTSEETQLERLSRLGLGLDRTGTVVSKSAVKPPMKPSIDSAAFRYAQLQARLKSEVQHAMTTDYMPVFISELETRMEALIGDDEKTNADGRAATYMEVACKDGYGRLITHALAAYYKLNSESAAAADGSRVTKVELPKKRVPLPDQRLSAFLRGGSKSGTSPASSPPVMAQSPPSVDLESDKEEDAQRGVLLRRMRFKKKRVGRVPPPAYIAASKRVSPPPPK